MSVQEGCPHLGLANSPPRRGCFFSELNTRKGAYTVPWVRHSARSALRRLLRSEEISRVLSNDGYSSQFYCSFADMVRQLAEQLGKGCTLPSYAAGTGALHISGQS